jgi:hypothetical protein
MKYWGVNIAYVEGAMINATPTRIGIVAARDSDGYALILKHSDGTEHALQGRFASLADAWDRAHRLAARLSANYGRTIPVETWTDPDAEERQ